MADAKPSVVEFTKVRDDDDDVLFFVVVLSSVSWTKGRRDDVVNDV